MTVPSLERSAARTRDLAIGLAGAAAAVVQGLAGLWGTVAIVVLATAGWIWLRRSRLVAPDRAAVIVQAIFVVVGVLLVWRLDFSVLAVAIAGMWLLVAAADLDRFVERFPRDAPASEQHASFRRRLHFNGLVAGVTLAVAVPGAVLTLRLQLVAVMLLATFVVIVVLRVIRQIPEVNREEDEPE